MRFLRSMILAVGLLALAGNASADVAGVPVLWTAPVDGDLFFCNVLNAHLSLFNTPATVTITAYDTTGQVVAGPQTFTVHQRQVASLSTEERGPTAGST